jgi:hypothetical protein
MKLILSILAFAAVLPGAAQAQRDVTRRAYTFLEDRLVVAVHAEAPGELQVVRGQRGRVEVAARSRDGFAGFGLSGDFTRRLRLTAVGSDAVQYLVVVPEHVAVTVELPRGGSADVPARDGIATYRWGDSYGDLAHRDSPDTQGRDDRAHADSGDPGDGDYPLSATTAGGLYVVHSGSRGRVPSLVDVPELASVRSIAVRIEGSEFRVAASRPLSLRQGDEGHMVIRIDGEPLDLVLFVPRGSSGLQLRSGDRRIADVTGGRPQAYCGSTVVQQPTPGQYWLTVFPSGGTMECR